MKKILFCMMMVSVLTGCVSPISRIAPEIITVKNTSSSLIGKVRETNVGSPMITEENLIYLEAYKVTNDYQPTPKHSLIKKDMILESCGRLQNGDILYGGSGLIFRVTGLFGETLTGYTYYIAVNSSGEPYGDNNGCDYEYVYIWSPKPPNFLEKTKILQRNSFSQELVYNGKKGNVIMILYREFIGNIVRPSYSQDLIYDLNESKNIRFKNMNIEILEATNSTIKFIVKSKME